MTAGEVGRATGNRDYRVIKVWNHKTSNSTGSAKLAIHVRARARVVKGLSHL